MENSKLKINGNLLEEFKFMDSLTIKRDDLRKLAENSIKEVTLNPENALKRSEEIYKILINIEPNEEIEIPWETFTEELKKVLKKSEDEFRSFLKSSNSETIRKVVGLSSLIGHLSNRGLIDYEIVHKWMTEILDDEEKKFVKLNLMEIVKDQVKNFMDAGGSDLNLLRIKIAIESEKLYEEKCEDLMLNLEVMKGAKPKEK